MLRLIRAWGLGRGCGRCQGYLRGHTLPAHFLSLSTCGSLGDRPWGLENTRLGPRPEGSGGWHTEESFQSHQLQGEGRAAAAEPGWWGPQGP